MTTVRELLKTCPYCTPDEIDLLQSISLTLHNDCTVVMIGAGPGELLMALLEDTLTRINSTVIDIVTTNWAQKHIESDDKIASHNSSSIQYVIDDSFNYGSNYPATQPPIDLLIVDGDHTPMGVQRDIEAFHFHLNTPSIIWFHDYNEASATIDYFARIYNWEPLYQVGYSKVFRVHNAPS